MKYEFRITIEINGNATEDEVRDYIGFECGAICQIENSNPFIDEDSDAEISRVDLF